MGLRQVSLVVLWIDDISLQLLPGLEHCRDESVWCDPSDNPVSPTLLEGGAGTWAGRRQAHARCAAKPRRGNAKSPATTDTLAIESWSDMMRPNTEAWVPFFVGGCVGKRVGKRVGK